MSENTTTQEFLQKLTPCIERGDLDACVEEAARVAQEMGAGELMEISTQAGMSGIYAFAYVLALASAHGLEGTASTLIKNDDAEIDKEKWLSSLELAHKIYTEKKLTNGAALFDTLKQLIKCVDELAEHRKMGLHILLKPYGIMQRNRGWVLL